MDNIPINKNIEKYSVGDAGTEEIFSPIAAPMIDGGNEFLARARILSKVTKNPNSISINLDLILFLY